MRPLLVGVLLATAAMPAAAAFAHSVTLRIVPPQPVAAITVRGGDQTRSVAVRDGKTLIPADLPLPWSLQLLRFEADDYTAADLQAARPWTIRELGLVRGTVQRPKAADETYTCLLAHAKSDMVREFAIRPDDRGGFEFRLAAGIYHGALLGSASGTRIRSAIVVKPGETTDLGSFAPEPAVPVSIRVADAVGRAGVAGARVIWDPPPEMLNSSLSRRLYARQWSAVTDRAGMAEIRAVGPVPHSVRWRIEAKGFASAHTAAVLLREPLRAGVPDVRLRPEPSVDVAVYFPRAPSPDLEHARLVGGENRDGSNREFVAVRRVPLREGKIAFPFTSYGLKRVWVESAAGNKLMFQTFEVTEPTTTIDLLLQEVEISGRVTSAARPLEGLTVNLADPLNGREFLAQAMTDEDGRFRLRTWATGTMLLYTTGSRSQTGQGKRFGTASAKLDLTGRSALSVDLEVPKSGFTLTVVDAETDAPVKARLRFRTKYRDQGGASSGTMGEADTDGEGRFDLAGYPEGMAKILVTARGYRSEPVEIAIRPDRSDLTVRLQRARPSSLRVVDVRGVPIRDASVMGGFENELDVQPLFETSTDANGRAEFDAPPPAGTMFYVAADGYALGMAVLAPEGEVAVALSPPNPWIVTLRQNNQPPDKVFLVMAAPAGREMIPLIALQELAQANGLNLYQLCGSSPTGDVVLPEFLGPGVYDLFLTRRGGTPFKYERAGTVRTPLSRNSILALD